MNLKSIERDNSCPRLHYGTFSIKHASSIRTLMSGMAYCMYYPRVKEFGKRVWVVRKDYSRDIAWLVPTNNKVATFFPIPSLTEMYWLMGNEFRRTNLERLDTDKLSRIDTKPTFIFKVNDNEFLCYNVTNIVGSFV